MASTRGSCCADVDLVGENPEQRNSIRRQVIRCQCARVESAEQLERACVCLFGTLTALVGEEIQRAANDNASPIEQAFDLIDLEGDPRVMLHCRQLRAWCRAAPQMAV